MAIAATSPSVGAGTGVDATSFTSNLTATAGSMYVAVSSGQRSGSTPPDPTVTHNSVTATLIKGFTYVSSARRMWVHAWDAGAGSVSLPITWDFGVTMTGFERRVYEVTGSDMANGLVQTFVQSVTTTADSSGSSASITLASAGDSGNRPFSVFAKAENVDQFVTQTSWTALGATVQHANPDSSLKAFWRSDAFETTASTSWTNSVGYGGIAFEIKVSGAGGSVVVTDAFGMSGFYG